MSSPPASGWHKPVMGSEVLHYLNPRPGVTIVDGTVGTGGHSLMILPHVLPTGRLVAIDRDQTALQLARKRLTEFIPHVTFVRENYRRLSAILKGLRITRVDGVLLDLGMSSLHVDCAERGFSFAKEGPLDMRMDPGQGATAEALVNGLTADELAMIFETFGEERFAKRIASRIVNERRIHPITTTTQLAHLVAEAIPSRMRHGRLHPATRVFQALRMAVNDELGALEGVLADVSELLNPGGRAVVITFHSLEDRLVKHAFARGVRDGAWTALTKKPMRPSEAEVAQNPRARSAKLRAIEQRSGLGAGPAIRRGGSASHGGGGSGHVPRTLNPES
ncbi:MAG: 16S rRNA (cytosine(1402)-N(4))-methyltransferase RsmH [Candidatus Omnitrophica bacterium]|nr:16S rRNA (cytosine(1402)-N(4))-methyltransferase RsmH [Candidatus Omnitrophota bacterium]MBI2495428.1 16S rRNA (cytosine(1402)-N(4))-methyltransferase RsmH [Candidatus Omnitrophota bacterium]MBI3021490.1 16S rRNA (cytosine(1402)-N(4))-methyltransferase RsmH [Candidatus Omnitrophota bacterium]MBI3084089.1 16S rRNA (cytosine(1402)-N(4))-methyltransferase RsmH [Candidatus Omnitrophota bacterium]